ncbi:MAG: hypothetical protein JOZ15_15685 [Acidobacteria bacterium]|nr:hypothetical protein [Acidobacteriota bacterium]
MPAKRGPAPPRRAWTTVLIRNTLLWMVPVAVLWWLATPVYNRVLLRSASGVLALFEHPAVTELSAKGDHDAYVVRRDFPPARSLVHPFRVTDVHFHLLLLISLFLAVPGLPWRERLANLTIAAAITVAYDVLLVVFIVEFSYSTQLGAWSLAHYGAFARNFYGLAKHLLDLPFKLALPLLLWCVFYLRRLLSASAGGAAAATEI